MNIILKSNNKKVRKFWTNADDIMIKHTINECYDKYDMIMKWDRSNIKHNLDWVSYHLRRFGYLIKEYKPHIFSKTYINVPEMSVNKIKKY